jgi:hypothetical protein
MTSLGKNIFVILISFLDKSLVKKIKTSNYSSHQINKEAIFEWKLVSYFDKYSLDETKINYHLKFNNDI